MVRRSSLGVGWTACVLLLAAAARGEDPALLVSRAAATYDAGDYAESARLYEEAIKAGAKTGLPAFNAACCHALLGKPDDAFARLDQAIEAGWRDVEHLKADTDLVSLHEDERWVPMVQRCEKRLADFLKSLTEPALREELLKRMKEDQRIRTAPDPDFKEWQRIDADNLAFMKTVIDKHGWPGKSMVGPDGALAAFLMVQHAASDLDFQKKCLQLLAKAVEQEEAPAADLAYLTDRVLVQEGKPQRYGTQFFAKDGVFKLNPIEDEAYVDARRKEVGLGPLAEYVKQVQGRRQP